jgi:hypothetical protein
MLGSSWVAAQLSASQEGLNSMSEWASINFLNLDLSHYSVTEEIEPDVLQISASSTTGDISFSNYF